MIPDVTPLFNVVITSAHNVDTKSRLIGKALMSFKQVVVAVGPTAQVKVGDWVVINVDMFPKTSAPGKHDVGNTVTVHPPLDKIGGTDYLVISDRHIKYLINR